MQRAIEIKSRNLTLSGILHIPERVNRNIALEITMKNF